jgi:hypothetical protein
MKKIFLLQEVIDDLVNTDRSLSSPLMKLNYFAKLIKNQELLDFTQNELNGYRDRLDLIPDYRKSRGTMLVDFQAYYNKHLGKPLPISMINKDYREVFEYVYVKEGIAVVEKLAIEAHKGDSEGYIATPLPMELLHILQEPARKLYRSNVRIDVIAARMTTNSSIVVEIPNAIRTKLLDFIMALADEFGYDIEIESFNNKADINNKTIINQMNTTINNSGDGNVINTGNKNQIENNVTLYKGDISRLQSEFQKQGIDPADIQEITEIVTSEQPNVDQNRLGEESNGWISKIINKSLNGVGKIATGISANILSSLIKQYYGMP